MDIGRSPGIQIWVLWLAIASLVAYVQTMNKHGWARPDGPRYSSLLMIVLKSVGHVLLTRRAYRFYLREWLPGDELRRSAGVLASLRSAQLVAPITVPPPECRT